MGYRGEIKNHIESFRAFRQDMKSDIYLDIAEKIWGSEALKTIYGDNYGRSFPERLSPELENVIERKRDYLISRLDALLVRDWVKFIAITGSVAARICHDNDDIDVFVVVKDNRLWLYRLIMWFKTIGKVKISREKFIKIRKSVDHEIEFKSKLKDYLCINFICEERGLSFEPQDLFTFHEIYHMHPVYNEGFFNEILIRNQWLETMYSAQIPKVNNVSSHHPSKVHEFVMKSINNMVFLPQLLYMWFHGVNPRIVIGRSKKGWFINYPQDSRERFCH